MKRAEFIKAFADDVAAGRQKRYPDIRRSEAAVMRMNDEQTAAKHWRKWRASLALLTVEQYRAKLK